MQVCASEYVKRIEGDERLEQSTHFRTPGYHWRSLDRGLISYTWDAGVLSQSEP